MRKCSFFFCNQCFSKTPLLNLRRPPLLPFWKKLKQHGEDGCQRRLQDPTSSLVTGMPPSPVATTRATGPYHGTASTANFTSRTHAHTPLFLFYLWCRAVARNLKQITFMFLQPIEVTPKRKDMHHVHHCNKYSSCLLGGYLNFLESSFYCFMQIINHY
jgi:hypothetical protein